MSRMCKTLPGSRKKVRKTFSQHFNWDISACFKIGISRPVSCFMSSWPVFIFPSSYSESSSSYPSNLCILLLQTFYLNLSCSTADLKRFSSVQLEYLSPVLKPSLILPELNTALARVLVPICIWTPYSGGATICIWSANKCR